jgi:hypothetical protein
MPMLPYPLRTAARMALPCFYLTPFFLLIAGVLLGPVLGWVVASALPQPARGDFQATTPSSVLDTVSRRSSHHHSRGPTPSLAPKPLVLPHQTPEGSGNGSGRVRATSASLHPARGGMGQDQPNRF